MKYTNHYDLPQPYVKACEYDDYDRVGDISVTGLLRPAQETYLMSRHWDELEEDVSKRVWLLLGSAAHNVLERSGQEPMVQERRMTMPCLGWEVSGKADLYDPETRLITDWKVTSAWALKYDKPDWESQENLYAHLHRHHDIPVDGLQIIAILRDWHERYTNTPNYPPVPVARIVLPMWSNAEAQDFLETKVRVHQNARAGNYLQCSDSERWRDSKGNYKRCEDWCPVRTVCAQGRRR